mgnify:CR=1 FL=1
MWISHTDSLAMQAVVPFILQREWALEYGLIGRQPSLLLHEIYMVEYYLCIAD